MDRINKIFKYNTKKFKINRAIILNKNDDLFVNNRSIYFEVSRHNRSEKMLNKLKPNYL